MNTWDKRYTDRVQLLVDILPVLAEEPRFALKGGTAINLFEHNLPRLSLDIDLAWLPVHDFAEDASLIAAALERLTEISPGVIATNFDDSISDQATKKLIDERLGGIAISLDAIARGILFALEQPPEVDVGSIVIRPTAQG